MSRLTSKFFWLVLFFIYSTTFSYCQNLETKTIELLRSYKNLTSGFIKNVITIDRNMGILLDAYTDIEAEKPLTIFENRIQGASLRDLLVSIRKDIKTLNEIDFPRINLPSLTNSADIEDIRISSNIRAMELDRYYYYYDVAKGVIDLYEDFESNLSNAIRDSREVAELYKKILTGPGAYGTALFLRMGLELDWYNFEVGYPSKLGDLKSRLITNKKQFIKGLNNYKSNLKELSGVLILQLKAEKINLDLKLKEYEKDKKELEELNKAIEKIGQKIEKLEIKIKNSKDREAHIVKQINELNQLILAQRNSISNNTKELNSISTKKYLEDYLSRFPKCISGSFMPNYYCCPTGAVFEECIHGDQKAAYKNQLESRKQSYRKKIQEAKNRITSHNTRISEYKKELQAWATRIDEYEKELDESISLKKETEKEFKNKLEIFNEKLWVHIIENLYSTNGSDLRLMLRINNI